MSVEHISTHQYWKNSGFGEVYPQAHVPPLKSRNSKLVNHLSLDSSKEVNFQKLANLKNYIYSHALLLKLKLKIWVVSLSHSKVNILSTNALDQAIRSEQTGKTAQVGEWTDGNAVVVSTSAKQTNQWKLDLIKSANHSIEISGSYCGGKVLDEALEAIEKRIQERPKLQVYLLTTPDFLNSSNKANLKTLVERYPENFHYVVSKFEFSSNLARLENHVKLVVVDEKYYVVGGTNYQDRLTQEADAHSKTEGLLDKVLGSGSNDMDIIGRGEILASTMRREFFKLYALLEYKNQKIKNHLVNHYKPNPITEENPAATLLAFDQHERLHKDITIKAVVSSPESALNGCAEEHARLLRKADKMATIAHMYFHPRKKILHALESLSECKTPVKIITTSTEKGTPLANQFYGYANMSTYMPILAQNPNAQVYTYRNGNNIFHKKVMVVERNNKPALTEIGSANFGGKSDFLDYELVVIIKNDKVAQEVLGILEQDVQKSQPITEEKVKAYRPYHLKAIIGKIQYYLFPILVG